MNSKAVSQYLARYAEPEANKLNISGCWRRAVVVPVYGESTAFIPRLLQFPPDILVIIIINAPAISGEEPEAIAHKQALNKQLFDYLVVESSCSTRLDVGIALDFDGRTMVCIDRFSHERLDPKQGVGLARKIGCDIALSLFAKGQLTEPWVHNSDADVVYPDGYFSLAGEPKVAAYLYAFSHTVCGDALVDAATQQYERWLSHYVDGLKQAGSPYAYHTLGSIIVVNLVVYAQVRGFPKRNAAEDFYLLNKLAKIGEIISLESPVIGIESRLSDRVPMGTGPAVASLISGEKTYAHYHPQAFDYLRLLLTAFGVLAEGAEFSEECEGQYLWQCDVPDAVLNWLTQQNFAAQLTTIYRNSTTPHQRLRQLHQWFDGFKTLKAVRYWSQQIDA